MNRELLQTILSTVEGVASADLITILGRSGERSLRVLAARGRLASEQVEGHVVDLATRPALAKALAGEAPRLLHHEHDEDGESEPDTFSELFSLPDDHSCLVAPLRVEGEILGVMTLDSAVCDAFDEGQLRAISALARLAARALADSEKADVLSRQLSALAERVAGIGDQGPPGAALVGRAPAFRKVVEQVRLVAPTPANVLIEGETGTGKEQAARAIHEWSERAAGPFVALNCSVLVPELALSELFGHERGAFTGAERRRAGRFELARGGTLFLDEVGELPAGAQAQLLRVLQERRFERVGGGDEIRADVRIVAATHRDLSREVGEGRFREDLLYRLRSFPIVLPPLRERPGDVTLLARHLLDATRSRFAMPELELSSGALRRLESHDWPGNVRELGNVIERAAILASGRRIQPRHLDLDSSPESSSLPAGRGGGHLEEPDLPETLNRLERAMAREILAALAESAGKVSGPGGAAERLGVKPTTLHSTIRRLGLRKTSGAKGLPQRSIR